MTESDALITGYDGTEIPAVVCRPDAEASVDRMVVLLHGVTTSKDEYQDTYRRLARQLADAGAASIRFDFRGHGDSRAPLAEYCVRNQLLDLLTVLSWAESEQGARRFCVEAASFGAPAAISAALVRPELVVKLVLLAPVLSFYDTFVEPKTEWAEEHFGIDKIRRVLNGHDRFELEPGFFLGQEFAADLVTASPESALEHLPTPVTVLHGNRDGMVPFAVSDRICTASDSVTLRVMENTEHGLGVAGDDDQAAAETQDNYDLLVRELISE
jgi:hypothetical protein